MPERKWIFIRCIFVHNLLLCLLYISTKHHLPVPFEKTMFRCLGPITKFTKNCTYLVELNSYVISDIAHSLVFIATRTSITQWAILTNDVRRWNPPWRRKTTLTNAKLWSFREVVMLRSSTNISYSAKFRSPLKT